MLQQESVSKASRKLFDSSDDEESDSKEDSTRFSIKPQFEGRAGQSLWICSLILEAMRDSAWTLDF